ncbi:hypothetical protein VNO77_27220 [Canavalia gladiata]|uniref:Uncharacterized protein n=1 Tax=Canavalia gladiata TaxID=3824 RepID=A0AAN9KTL9_CANGL
MDVQGNRGRSGLPPLCLDQTTSVGYWMGRISSVRFRVAHVVRRCQFDTIHTYPKKKKPSLGCEYLQQPKIIVIPQGKSG